MFEKLREKPDDPIIQLFLQAEADPSPNVVDLTAGVYKNESGQTPVLDAVRAAEPRRLVSEDTRKYQGIIGDERFNTVITELALGSDNGVVREGRVSTMHTVAGSAAVFMGGRLLCEAMEEPIVWVGRPTWANHYPLLQSAGVQIAEFPYYDAGTSSLLYDQMMSVFQELPAQSVVLLHGGCHNPSGADLSSHQWRQVAGLFAERGLVPFIDVAYQGFGEGLEEDACGWRHMLDSVPEALIAYSCSKNFSVYRDRAGALLTVSANAGSARRTCMNMMSLSRATYSMPAAHGAFLVAEILSDSALRSQWETELATMRERIRRMRRAFVRAMDERGLGERFGFVEEQNGMFSFLGINPEEVVQMREEHSIYMIESSRISLAGLTSGNLNHVADSLAAVIGV